jgi:hypothetical protein
MGVVPVVGVVSRTSSRPSAFRASRICPVSSRGMSGTSNPDAPAAFKSAQNFFNPRAMMGLKYVNKMIGADTDGEASESISRTFCRHTNESAQMSLSIGFALG